MPEVAPRYYPSGSPVSSMSRFGGQPFIIGAAALLAIVVGIGAIAAWRAYTGSSPELDRVIQSRQLQARATQASEQLVEKTKGLEATQQESIDQLQVMQDQLQTARRLIAFQQAETKRLSEQITTLTEAIEGLRQTFASARSDDPAPSVRKSSRKKVYRSAQRKRASRG
jgi:flagellar motility protein MotE (MotC chaperone)